MSYNATETQDAAGAIEAAEELRESLQSIAKQAIDEADMDMARKMIDAMEYVSGLISRLSGWAGL